jgi:predicted dehydrogenase
MKAILNRRHFLRSTVFGTGVLLLPSSRVALAYDANSKLNVAAVGAAGQGRSNINNIAACGENIVALCDVDHAYAADTFKEYPQAKVFRDFRRMLDTMAKHIDAVAVSTPDHTHAVAAVACMRHGKAVFCEKPLTRTVHEARVMREVAVEEKVITQMGNQGSAAAALRRAVELVQGGVLGEIGEAHVWFDGGNGPLERPSDTPPVPETLDWDKWLGPAERRPYHPDYLPGSWRGWRAFGSGIVGDFGCHTANIMFRALQLNRLWDFTKSRADRVVVRVEAFPSEVNQEGYPRACRAVVELPPRVELPPVRLTLYAKERPPEALMLGYPMSGWGDLLVGAKGSLYSDCPWNTRYVLLPERKFDGFKGGPPQTLPRSPGHHREWVEAIKGQGKAFSPFEVGGPLTELLQLANLATLVEGPLDYDVVTGRILNSARADALLHRPYREGWTL